MGLVGNNDNIVPLRQYRVLFARLGAELMNQGKDIAVILAQQLAQMPATVGLGFRFGNNTWWR